MAVLVNKPAPEFKAQACMPDGTFKEVKLSDYKGKYVVLFFYPLDFTFVCPSELIAFHNRIAEFKKRDVQVLGCSVDSHFTHAAWRNTPVEHGGIGQVDYPLLADLTKNIARDFDVLIEGSGVALRGSFLIDKNGSVQHQVVNNLPLGRNIDEMLRMVDAVQFFEKHGEVCPAGWTTGKKGMKADASGVACYLKENAKAL